MKAAHRVAGVLAIAMSLVVHLACGGLWSVEPTPEPAVEEPTPEPAAEEPTPEPAAEEPMDEPDAAAPTAGPTAEAAAAEEPMDMESLDSEYGGPPLYRFETRSRWLILTSTGLWAVDDGEKLLDIKGREIDGHFGGDQLIDARREGFFLYTEDRRVYVVRRRGNRFAVYAVAEGYRLVLPGRGAAIVKPVDGDPPWPSIIDLSGRIVAPYVEKYYYLLWQDKRKGFHRVGYWWAPDAYDFPIYACVAPGPCEGWGCRCERRIFGDGSRALPYQDLHKFKFRDHWSYDKPYKIREPLNRPPEEDYTLIVRRSDGEVVGEIDEQNDFDVVWYRVHESGHGCPGASPLYNYYAQYQGSACGYAFYEGRAAVAAMPVDSWARAWREQISASMGYIDPSGEFVVPPPPGRGCMVPSGPFHGGRAFFVEKVPIATDGGMGTVCGLWLIDREGRRLAGPWTTHRHFLYYISSAYEGISETPDLPPYLASIDNLGPHGIYGQSGHFFSDGLAAVPVEGGFAYVDRDGETVLPGPYQAALPFRVGIALVVEDGEVRYIRKDGSVAFVEPERTE